MSSIEKNHLKVFQIQWDGEWDIVEATSFGGAVDIWRKHMRDEEDTVVARDIWDHEDPEQVVRLSDKPVLR